MAKGKLDIRKSRFLRPPHRRPAIMATVILRHHRALQRRQSSSAEDLDQPRSYRIIKSASSRKLHPPRLQSSSLPDFSHIVTINVGGRRYQTLSTTLDRFPHSVLGDPVRRARYLHAESGEYFFDRNRYCFEPILELYQTGEGLVRPTNIPIKTFMAELFFYDLGLQVLENYLRREGLYREPVLLPRNKGKRWLFRLFEYPDSSGLARMIATMNIVLILVSIASFCAQTMPEYQVAVLGANATTLDKASEWETTTSNPLFIVESVCTAWFSVDLVTRFVVSPIKRRFFVHPLNIVDFLSVVPYYFTLLAFADTSNSSARVLFLTTLRILRIVKIFRVFKLGRYSTGLQVYALTLHAARYEVGLMLFVAMIGVVVFSSAMFFAEQTEGATTQFTSVPAGFWYTIITWTTVGYGDIVPRSVAGRVVGACCALCGILALSFMVPVVVAYFEHYFYRARDMEKLDEVFEELDKIKLERVESRGEECRQWVSLHRRDAKHCPSAATDVTPTTRVLRY